MADSRTQAPNWMDWIKSDEGKRAADIATLRGPNAQQYLENRLWAAFAAGAKYEREVPPKKAKGVKS